MIGRSTDSELAPGDVGITYNQGPTDGVGSQLQRIYGLYAMSRALHIKYVHSPILHVTYQGFVPFLTGQNDSDFEIRYNAFFALPSDDFDLDSCKRVRVPYVNENHVGHYQEYAARTGRPVLLRTTDPFHYNDFHPWAYQVLRSVSPYRGYRTVGPIRVCIHVRWGDIRIPGRQDGGDRLLPTGYYLRACGTVIEALRRQGAPFIVRLHTEVPPRPYTVQTDMPGMFFYIHEPATVDPAKYSLEEFEALPNLETLVNAEPREVLDDLATADVLILSRSSLGHVAGYLNPHGLVIYAPWWHPPLPGWLVADQHGNLDAVEVAKRTTDLVRRRS
jgi:hypothetical protein